MKLTKLFPYINLRVIDNPYLCSKNMITYTLNIPCDLFVYTEEKVQKFSMFKNWNYIN